MKLSFEKKVVALLVLILLFVSTSGILVYINLSSIIDEITEEARPDEKLIVLKGVMYDISDAENSAKSFGYTKDPNYLDQFNRKTAAVASKVETLRELSKNQEEYLVYVESLDSLTALKFSVLEDLLIVQDQFKVDQVFDEVIRDIEVAEEGQNGDINQLESDTVKTGFFKRLKEKRRKKKEGNSEGTEEIEEDNSLNQLEEQITTLKNQSLEEEKRLKVEELRLIRLDQKITSEIKSIYEKMEEEESVNMDVKLEEADQSSQSTKGLVAAFTILVFLLLMFASYAIVSYVRRNDAYKKALKEAKDEMQFKNDEVRDSILYAQRIQRAILPDQKKIDSCLPNSFILYKPKDIVAGDFYWMMKVKDQVLYAVADCTGHGVPGAMVSVVCSNALNRSVREFGLIEPARILEKARELVIETLDEGDLKVSDGMDIALCSIDTKSNMVQYAGANNSLYLIKNNKLHEIKPDKQPVGRYTNSTAFTNHVVQLKEGDQMYLFTDGMADQFGGPNGKKFKYKAFRQLLVEVSSKPLAQQQTTIEKEFQKWRGNVEQVDDVCIMGLRL